MIRLFQEPVEAITYASSIVAGGSSRLVAFVSRAEPLWISGDQILIFPVIEINRIPVIDLFDVFSSDFSVDAELSNAARDFIAILSKEVKFDILRISEWIIDIQIYEKDKHLFANVIKRAKSLNNKMVVAMREKYGRMRSIDPQPFAYHKDLRIIRIGIR